MRSLLLLLAALCCLLGAARAQHNILAYGAVPDSTSAEAALANSNALVKAIGAASVAAQQRGWNQTSEQFWERVHDYSALRDEGDIDPQSPIPYPPEQTVVVPEGRFFISYTFLRGVRGVLLDIQGTLLFHDEQELWWKQAPEGYYGGLHFVDSEDLTFIGKPQQFAEGSPLPITDVDVDGRGYDWWLAVLLEVFDHRPHMMYFERCSRVAFTRLYVRDAPMFHFLLEDSEDVYYGDFTIFTDVVKQQELVRLHAPRDADTKMLKVGDGEIPIFPLNTDGVDPAAENVLIERFFIEMYDDAVAVKPCNGGWTKCHCASNMMIRNGGVKWGVGLTIGSVPPHEHGNCVRNITFRNVDMELPFKALYIKTNPGDHGFGSIKQIYYEEIDIQTPLWYPIWFGPQQQKQPANGTDTGCSFFYPLNTTCPTQPRIDVDDVRVVNVSSTGGLTLPGVLLCDERNPCKNFVFDNVRSDGPFLVDKEYVCHNVVGVQRNNHPAIACLQTIGQDEPLPIPANKQQAPAQEAPKKEEPLIALW